nr:ISAs1 family transposase [Segeticoccus rhizosphaerae]
MPSCLTTALSRPSLVEVFGHVPDPRDPRGVRHSVATVLTLAQAAVVAGAKTLLAISEWITDASREELTRLGIRANTVLPCESTIRRTLAAVDADDLDARLGAWMATRTGHLAGRRVIAVDGKSMRGATSKAGVMPHLLSALTHDTGVVTGQLVVDAKTNEIPALRVLLDQFDLTDVVVTADALHCQRATASYITGRGGHYALTVKANQPRLRQQLKALPWSNVPATTSTDTSHGRRVRRTIRAVQARTGSTSPARRRSCKCAGPEPARAAGIPRSCTSSVPWTWLTHPVPRSRPGSRATGASKTPCTGYATSPSTRTATNYEPGTDPTSWRPSATSPSACCGSPAGPTSPPGYDITPATATDPSTSS